MIKWKMNFLENKDLFETLKHTKNYFSADMATKALGFISIPIFTRLLTTEEYGMLNIYNSYLGIFVVLLTLNSFTSVSRYYYENEKDIAGFMGTTVIFSAGCLFISTLIFMLFIDTIAAITGFTQELVLLSIPHVICLVIISLFNQIMGCQKRSKLIASTSIFQSYVGFAISVGFVYFMTTNRYLGNIYGALIAACLMAFYIVFKFHQYTRISWNTKHFFYILNYSIPQIPYVLGAVILAQFDRIMIGNINGQSQAGLYSLAYNIGMLVAVFAGAIQRSIIPDFFKFMENKEYQRLFELDKKAYRIILIFALGLIYYSKEVIWLLADAKFHSALSIIPIIAISYVIMTIANVYCRYMGYAKKTIWMAVTLIIPGIINIFLNMYFLPKFGYQAGAYTTLVSYIIMLLLANVIARRIVQYGIIMPIRMFAKGSALFLVFVSLFYIGISLNISSIPWFFLKIILLIVFTIAIFGDSLFKTRTY